VSISGSHIGGKDEGSRTFMVLGSLHMVLICDLLEMLVSETLDMAMSDQSSTKLRLNMREGEGTQDSL
jgi:hypothetical protein